jgi:hypothetical protein
VFSGVDAGAPGGPRRIELYIEPDNIASRGVARRCGLSKEGVLRGLSAEDNPDPLGLGVVLVDAIAHGLARCLIEAHHRSALVGLLGIERDTR